jgi:hypothetical protein
MVFDITDKKCDYYQLYRTGLLFNILHTYQDEDQRTKIPSSLS